MTNLEKYKSRFMTWCGVDRRTGLPEDCRMLECKHCRFRVDENCRAQFWQWIGEQYTDWDTVKIGALIMVKSDDIEELKCFAWADGELIWYSDNQHPTMMDCKCASKCDVRMATETEM